MNKRLLTMMLTLSMSGGMGAALAATPVDIDRLNNTNNSAPATNQDIDTTVWDNDTTNNHNTTDTTTNTNVWDNDTANSHNTTDTTANNNSYNTTDTRVSSTIDTTATTNTNSYNTTRDAFNVSQNGLVNANEGSVAAVGNLATDYGTIYDGDLAATAGTAGTVNASTGFTADSVIGNDSAWFNNVGIGINGSPAANSSFSNNQTTLLNPR